MVKVRFGIMELLWKGNTKARIILFIVIPFILLGVQLLPQLRDLLVLHPANPTITGILFNSYAHASFQHLNNNLITYLFVISLIFTSGVYADKKKLYSSLVWMFVLVPPTTSLLIIWFTPQLKNVVGFSAIVAALFGCLTISLLSFVKKFYKIQFRLDVGWSFFILNSGIIALIYGSYPLAAMILVILIIALYRYDRWHRVWELRKVLDKKSLSKNKFTSYIVLLGIISISLSAAILFPSVLIAGDKRTNILSHYAGYFLGYYITYIAYSVRK